jgi:hypothetical protein
MIYHDVKGGSPEWFQLRLGIPTASQFDRILTPKTLKESGQAHEYACELLAEWALGIPLEQESSGFMQRGTALEAEAVRYYEMISDAETTPGGFCTTDDERIGCSPDRLVGGVGGLEIKCPAPKNHVRYLLGSPLEDYLLQVQGSLWVTKREWWDVMSYAPGFPSQIVRVDPDPVVQKALDSCMPEFLSRMDKMAGRLALIGVTSGLQRSAA